MTHDKTGVLSRLQYYERGYYFTSGAMDFFHSTVMDCVETERHFIVLERLRDSHNRVIYRVDVLDKETGDVVVYIEGKREKIKKIYNYLVNDYWYNKGVLITPPWIRR